jgi:hypothetical protein
MNSHCHILHLEDDENDSLIFERALSMSNFDGTYHSVQSVDEAIAYLVGAGKFANRLSYPLPGVLVADNAATTPLLMAWLERQEQFRSLVRIILTGGMSPADSEKWLARGIQLVLHKGTRLEDMIVSAEKILRHCRL